MTDPFSKCIILGKNETKKKEIISLRREYLQTF